MLNGKVVIISFTVRLIINALYKYFPKPNSLGGKVKVNLDLSNYATKVALKIQQMLIHQNLLGTFI